MRRRPTRKSGGGASCGKFRPFTPERNGAVSERQQVRGGEAGNLLLDWMRLLGWQIRLEQDGLEGVAEHMTDQGERLVVRVRAEQPSELAGVLFERALASLEASRARLDSAAAAAWLSPPEADRASRGCSPARRSDAAARYEVAGDGVAAGG
jgi:hypothetical protein